MGNNKKENFIFISMICGTMVFIMTCFNIGLREGFSIDIFSHAVKKFIPVFAIALASNFLMVRKIVIGVINKLLTSEDSAKKKKILIPFFIRFGMSLWMSFIGAVSVVGFGPDLPIAYGIGAIRSLSVSLPLNYLIVTPLIKKIFVKIFPPIVENIEEAVEEVIENIEEDLQERSLRKKQLN
ncbi:hypothetical protein [Terrisporobacter sp.]